MWSRLSSTAEIAARSIGWRWSAQRKDVNTLTPNQARFVKEYLIDLNATQAAIRAGYSPKGATVRGSELLANRKVSEALKMAQDERSAELELDAEWVLDRLRTEAERTGEGSSHAARVRALELIGKHIGDMFPELVKYKNVSDDEIERQIEARKARIARLAGGTGTASDGESAASSPFSRNGHSPPIG